MQNFPLKQVIVFSLLFFGIACCAIFFFKKSDYPYQLSVIAVFQNEDRFLKEWLDFYRIQGVDHFYLFNNLSEDHYREVLSPYLKAGIVELFDWPYASKPGNKNHWKEIQSAAYRQGLTLAKGQSKWVALVDTDEFLFAKDKKLVDFLKDYEECSSILVNWQLFGTSQVKRVPEGKLMIEALVMQAPPRCKMNQNCKSIVRPETVKYCNSLNSVVHYPWTYSVDPDKRAVLSNTAQSRSVNIDKIRINHYWSRDEEFFYTNKLARNENWGDNKLGCLQKNQEANQVESHEILAWLPELKRLQKEDPITTSL